MVRSITVRKIRLCASNVCEMCTVLLATTGSLDQLEERLRAAQAHKQHAERQEVAGQRILTQTRDEKKKL